MGAFVTWLVQAIDFTRTAKSEGHSLLAIMIMIGVSQDDSQELSKVVLPLKTQVEATQQKTRCTPRDYTAKLLYRCGPHKYNAQQIAILTWQTAVPASNVADFYITKYLSKAQEALGPAIRAFTTGMRALNVANFYMTKYLSKAQEALRPVIQPGIAGMRRIAATEIDAAPKETLQIDAASEELDAAAEELEDAAYERLVNEDLVNALVRCKL